MPGEIVNLRQARKRNKRAEKERLADENRVKYGQSKAERMKKEADAERTTRVLDGHLRDKAGTHRGEDGDQ